MIKVTIADVKQDISTGCGCLVILVDEAGYRLLPIMIGEFEARAIAIGLRKEPLPRPITYTFMANALETIGASVEEVCITRRDEGGTFYAVVRFRVGDTVQEVDARPSDAMALAVRTGSPIYATEELWQEIAMDISEEMRESLDKKERSLLQASPQKVLTEIFVPKDRR
jgi:bifunctional DNase/RNase